MERIFRLSGVMGHLGEENFFRPHPDHSNISTRDALKGAQEVTGIKSADITRFAAGKKGK